MTTDEAREAAAVAAFPGSPEEPIALTLTFREVFLRGFDAGVVEGRRQAREAVAAVDPDSGVVTSSLVGGWTLGKRASLAAIDALGGEQ